MSLNVKTRKVDGIVVVDMSGRLTIGEPVLLLRETLRVQVNDGARQFVLNLGDVSYIDSSGLGELVSAYTTVRNKQGDVKLLNLTAKAKDLLQMTKLLTVFDVYEDEAKAIEALKGSKTTATIRKRALNGGPKSISKLVRLNRPVNLFISRHLCFHFYSLGTAE